MELLWQLNEVIPLKGFEQCQVHNDLGTLLLLLLFLLLEDSQKESGGNKLSVAQKIHSLTYSLHIVHIPTNQRKQKALGRLHSGIGRQPAHGQVTPMALQAGAVVRLPSALPFSSRPRTPLPGYAGATPRVWGLLCRQSGYQQSWLLCPPLQRPLRSIWKV